MAMASDARNSATVAAINAAVSAAENLYSPREERRWKMIWARYWCFKSNKREKRIVPAARSEGASGSAREWPTVQAGLALAPPSSPASFVHSTVQSPASFALSLSAASASMCSPGRPNTMFMIGPYAHETQLVSPPGFSTFTTEPSTAPLTPPPELAHLTTPSSPDVPFAQYITSSLQTKRAARETASPLSTSNIASPCDTPVSYTPTSSNYCLGSPVAQLVSPAGYSSGEVIFNEKHPLYTTPNGGQMVSSFPTYDPFASANFDGVPFAAFILPSDAISKCEEQSSSLLVQPVSGHESGGLLYNGASGTLACEHGASSSQEGIHQMSVNDHSNSPLQMDPGEAFEAATQAKVDLPRDAGLSSRPMMGCNDNVCSTNQDIQRDVVPFSGVQIRESIKKSEKLQELLAHERKDVTLLPNTAESEVTFLPNAVG